MGNTKRSLFYCVLLLACILPTSASADLAWPIDRPAYITGTFCEPRGHRFHAGIDVSCSGRKGFRIFAAEDGYVSSVLYQKWGIGYAVFVTHPDGRRSFYGHLEGFSDLVASNEKVLACREAILNRTDFELELAPRDLPVKGGTVIGYSGDSGIGKEHFHFEVRDPTDVNLNPLRYGLTVRDESAPVITEVRLIPLDGRSLVDGVPVPRSFAVQPVKAGKDRFSLAPGTTPSLGGNVGISVKVYDRVGYKRKVAVYGLELTVNGKVTYTASFDRLARGSLHHMGLFMDLDGTDNSEYTYYLFSKKDGTGVIHGGADGRELRVEIAAFDARLNRSVFSAAVKTLSPLNRPLWEKKHNLKKGRKLILNSDDGQCRAEFTRTSALYDEEVAVVRRPRFNALLPGLSSKSDVYMLSPSNLCVDEPVMISLRYRGEDARKVGVFAFNVRKNIFYFHGNDYDSGDGGFRVKAYRMEGFFLLRDDRAPRVSFNVGRAMKSGRSLRFRVSDVGTGIDLANVRLTVDGRAVVWDYDPDYGVIEVLPHNPIWRKGSHLAEIQLRDRAGNMTPVLRYPYSI